MRAGSAGVPTTPRGALLDSAFVGRLQDCRFERQCPRVRHRWKRARAFDQVDVGSGLNVHGNDQRPRVGFKRASWPVSEVCASDGVPLFRTVGRHFHGASRGFVELGDGRVHRMPVRGIASGHAQMAVLDESGRPYLRFRIAREPCPRASRIEAVAEPDRRITAERLLIIALVSSSLSTFFVRPGG